MISVCIPTYNGSEFIKQQLDSILPQLTEKDEIIISDDSSTDDTVEIIKAYNDKRILLLENCKFNSPIFNLENALKHVKGDFVFLSDQDDIWLPGKVKTTLNKLLNYDIIVCDGYIVNNELKIIQDSYFKWKGSGPGFIKNLIKNSYLGCSLAFNRRILDVILPFPQHIAMHDIWIGLMSELIGKPFFFNSKLFYYRRHEGNFTASIQKTDDKLSNFNFFYKIWYRLIMLFYLLSRYLKIKFLR